MEYFWYKGILSPGEYGAAGGLVFAGSPADAREKAIAHLNRNFRHFADVTVGKVSDLKVGVMQLACYIE